MKGRTIPFARPCARNPRPQWLTRQPRECRRERQTRSPRGFHSVRDGSFPAGRGLIAHKRTDAPFTQGSWHHTRHSGRSASRGPARHQACDRLGAPPCDRLRATKPDVPARHSGGSRIIISPLQVHVFCARAVGSLHADRCQLCLDNQLQEMVHESVRRFHVRYHFCPGGFPDACWERISCRHHAASATRSLIDSSPDETFLPSSGSREASIRVGIAFMFAHARLWHLHLRLRCRCRRSDIHRTGQTRAVQ